MLVDTWAWLECFAGSAHGKVVLGVLQKHPSVATCPVVLAEVGSVVERRSGREVAERRVAELLDACTVIPHDEAQGIAAGRIHTEMKRRDKTFGLADAFVLAAARSREMKVLTGDPHFEGLPDAIVLK